METSYLPIDMIYHASGFLSFDSMHKVAAVCTKLQDVMADAVHKRYLSQIDRLIQDAAVDLKQPELSFKYNLDISKSQWVLKKQKFQVIKNFGQLLSPLYRDLYREALPTGEYIEKLVEISGDVDSATFLQKPRLVAFLQSRFLLEDVCDQFIEKKQWVSALQLAIFAFKSTDEDKQTYKNCGIKIGSYLLQSRIKINCPPPEYLIDLVFFLCLFMAQKSNSDAPYKEPLAFFSRLLLVEKSDFNAPYKELFTFITIDKIQNHRISLEEGITRISHFTILSDNVCSPASQALLDLSANFMDVGELPLSIKCFKGLPKGAILDRYLFQIFPSVLQYNFHSAKEVAQLFKFPSDRDKAAKTILDSCNTDLSLIVDTINLLFLAEDKILYLTKFCDLLLEEKRFEEAVQFLEKFDGQLSDSLTFKVLKDKVSFFNEIYSPTYLSNELDVEKKDKIRNSNAQRLYFYHKKTLAFDWCNSIENASTRNKCFEFIFNALELYREEDRDILDFLKIADDATVRREVIRETFNL